MWHWHPDFFGWSQKGGSERRAHLRVLFVALERLLTQAQDSPVPVQVFALVSRYDSPVDAVYAHTPNLDGGAFPFRFDGVAFDAPPPDWLAPFVDLTRFEIGAARLSWDRQYFVVPRGRLGRRPVQP